QRERCAVKIGVGSAPVWMIQHVKSLGAKLQAVGLGDGKILPDPEIHEPYSRVVQRISALGAKCPCSRDDPHRSLARGAVLQCPIGKLCAGVEPGSGVSESCPLDARVANQSQELRAAARTNTCEVIAASD